MTRQYYVITFPPKGNLGEHLYLLRSSFFGVHRYIYNPTEATPFQTPELAKEYLKDCKDRNVEWAFYLKEPIIRKITLTVENV